MVYTSRRGKTYQGGQKRAWDANRRRLCRYCGAQQVKIVGTDPSRQAHVEKRRRLECSSCGNRYSTYELSADYYHKVIKSDHLIDKICSMLEGLKDEVNGVREEVDLLLTHKTARPCQDCVHSNHEQHRCELDFEYMTVESIDCISHKSIQSSN